MTDCTGASLRVEGQEDMPIRTSMTDCTGASLRVEGQEDMPKVDTE
ncbi:hypothetical protein CLV70_10785 [Pseudosporangium ferrugineum]|uniref:Uncharacterized protein n=1 Tax=Pseudosporangium ferrugineum TaxID=439699 RepID=A0A2T0S5U0_9ACTN|nr:hypothetical protein CLV70_10785 [Pseudosporangium ferrugineum]